MAETKIMATVAYRNKDMTSEELITLIIQAFDNVILNDGIGLWEAQGLDDYEDEATLKKYRANDEKHDWRKIDTKTLARCESSLSFFDAAGMRFHLPAFLIAEIKGETNTGPLFHLTYLNDYAQSRFVTLNSKQRSAIVAFLKWCLLQDEYMFERKSIKNVLVTFWQDS